MRVRIRRFDVEEQGRPTGPAHEPQSSASMPNRLFVKRTRQTLVQSNPWHSRIRSQHAVTAVRTRWANMHPNLYLAVEYSGRGNRWTTFFRYPDVGNAPVLHTLLGADESADVRESHRLKPRGFPDDVCDRSLHEDSYTVDDEASTSDIGDVLDDVRFCSRADADSWVDAGNSRYIARRYKVTDPDAYGKSHADLDELQGLIALASNYEIESLHLFRSVVSAMKSLEADGHKKRIVYWFSES